MDTSSLYVGVTSDLLTRIAQHRAGTFDGHSKRHGIIRLVYFEMAGSMEMAIAKGKRNLIERDNPAWNDLAVGLGLEPLVAPPSRTVDPGTSPG